MLVMRHKGMDGRRALGALKILSGQYNGRVYPLWRMLLFLTTLADNVHFADWPVCSELVAKFLINCELPEVGVPLIDKRGEWAGVTPDMLDDATACKECWEVVYEGAL
jgi:hypothetical protein